VIEAIRDGRSRPGHVLVHGESRAHVQDTLAAVGEAIEIEYADGSRSRPLNLHTWTYA
jgi:hypothetical protein